VAAPIRSRLAFVYGEPGCQRVGMLLDIDNISSIVGYDRVLFRKYEHQRGICTGRMIRRPTTVGVYVTLTDFEAHASSSICTT
jgi:hypothetical protein